MTRNKNLSAVMHFAPILLSLACLTISMSGFSVYEGFNDGGSGTYLSLVMMSACLVISITGACKKDTSPSMFWLAVAVSLVVFLAMLDEYFKGHESIGKYIIRNVHLLPERQMAFSDDIIILIGTIIGSVAFYFVVKRTRNDALQRKLLWCIVITAVGHGVLDILSHKIYLWEFLLPDISLNAAYELTEQLSCFEEWMKIWCEWFVLLFLLRIFHKQENSVIWSSQILVASILACAGLWAIPPGTKLIPYFVLWPTEYGIIRNYHILGGIFCIWLTWGLITYRLFLDNLEKVERAGWFWLCPLSFLLFSNGNAQISGVAVGVIAGMFAGKNRRISIIILAIVMLSGFIDSHILIRLSFVLGFAVACFIIHGHVSYLIVGILIVTPLWVVLKGIHIYPGSIILAVGFLLPFILFTINRNQKWILIPVYIIFIPFILTSDPSLIFLIWFMSITLHVRIVPGQVAYNYRKLTLVIVMEHVLLVLVLMVIYLPDLMPNYKYKCTSLDIFSIGFQKIMFP